MFADSVIVFLHLIKVTHNIHNFKVYKGFFELIQRITFLLMKFDYFLLFKLQLRLGPLILILNEFE